jgi:hypothetical protein
MNQWLHVPQGPLEQVLIDKSGGGKSSGRQTQLPHENVKRKKKWGKQVENNGRRR